MPRQAKAIKNDVALRALTRPGYHAIGDGLYLQVTATGARSWICRFTFAGKRHEMGLGAYPIVSLKDARAKAMDCRRAIAAGRNPLQERRAAAQATGITFEEAAERYLAAHEAAWRNPKHRQQWRSTLSTYAYPAIGALPVATIDVGAVIGILEPLWKDKTETASRLRGRIESVLDWCTARGYRHGDNPARWRGHLDKLLPKRSKVQRVQHHAAMAYSDLPAFYASLQAQEGLGALALRFTILTAARTGEVIGARWQEIDGATWSVPAERMKGNRPHRVPLSDEALAILDVVRPLASGPDNFIFSGMRKGTALSNMSLSAVLRRMDRGAVTVHGFRSCFRDWCSEQTAYPREVCESALAHVNADRVEAAYLRSDLFERRSRLMRDWGSYITTPRHAAVVVGIGDSRVAG
ncbi:MAG: integrase arm-type DNA-binding domain-containing protein [Defluviicoccus sp.]